MINYCLRQSLGCFMLVAWAPLMTMAQRHQPLYERFKKHSSDKRYEEASKVLDSLLTIDPGNNFWLFSKVETEALRGNLDIANTFLEKSIRNGYVYLDDLLHNPNLSAIRNTAKYQRLVKDVENQYSGLKLSGNDQRLTIEVPPLMECYVIMLYLGNSKHPLVTDQQNHPYFTYINNFFSAHRGNPLINKLREKYPGHSNDWINNLRAHHNLRVFYPFDSTDITQVKRFPIELDSTLLRMVSDFALETDFMRFYRENLDFYGAMKKIMYTNYSFGSHLVSFFNRHFDERINRFNVYFSPIYGGWQHGPTVKSGTYTECFYFGGIMYSGTRDFYYPDVNLLFTLLTEFDHTCINPITLAYKKQIEQLIHKTKLLNTSGSVSYGTIISTLDEYITWAFALHFFYEYTPAEYPELEKRIVRSMEKFRGFARFGEFMEFYKKYILHSSAYPKLKDFYPEILSWVAALKAR